MLPLTCSAQKNINQGHAFHLWLRTGVTECIHRIIIISVPLNSTYNHCCTAQTTAQVMCLRQHDDEARTWQVVSKFAEHTVARWKSQRPDIEPQQPLAGGPNRFRGENKNRGTLGLQLTGWSCLWRDGTWRDGTAHRTLFGL